ncbi:M20 family metallopeptidase [Sulfurisphaera javensis]|uniref:M20 family metallopeptidase n=1 Tax=Sulfurisphaera javensis TaxID=2049879 RepID=A0AAT9GVC8_9CREN
MIEKLLSDLVSFKTVNPPGENYSEISSYLRDLLKEIGFTVEIIEIDDEYVNRNYIYYPRNKGYKRYIVLAKNDKEPLVHFNAHYDVVPPEEGWLTYPFKLKIVDDYAYGRGTSDMKGGIVSMYLTLSKAKVPVEISLVPDEESGGIGTKYLIEKRKVSPKYVIIGEPSFPNIFIGHYGIIRGFIKVKGKQAHASIGGDNAFLKASKFALEIEKVYGGYIKRKNKRISLNLGGYTINSSDNDGIVPGEFTFSFYRSISPEEEEVEEEVKKFINDIGRQLNIDFEFSIKSNVPGYKIDEKSELVKIAEECVKRAISINPAKLVSQIRYDAVFFMTQVINIGPGEEAHNPNEKVNIKNVRKVSEIYDCILNALK